MFKRRTLYASHIDRKQVKLGPGETAVTRAAEWIAEISAKPRFCREHTRCPLVLGRTETQPTREEFRRWGEQEAKVRPGEHEFTAWFYCPACQVAAALCPPEFHETSFETFDISTPERARTLAKAREFVHQANEHGCGFAVFVGPPGPGKTRLACNVIRELHCHDALYARQGQITLALRASYGRKEVILRREGRFPDEEEDESPPTPLEIVQEVRFLALDEIGCAALANDERLFLDELLKHRYDHKKPTILISNLPLNELKQFLGDAVTDRISSATGSGKFIVQFSGESFRRSVGDQYLVGQT